MSRGLGNRQRDMLEAIRALDAEYPDRYFTLSLIIARMFMDSATLLDLAERRAQARAKSRADLQQHMSDLAERGDAEAKRWLFLDTHIIPYILKRPYGPGRKVERRINREELPRWIERELNPSRIAAGLRNRGLIKGANGWFAITDKGRSF